MKKYIVLIFATYSLCAIKDPQLSVQTGSVQTGSVQTGSVPIKRETKEKESFSGATCLGGGCSDGVCSDGVCSDGVCLGNACSSHACSSNACSSNACLDELQKDLIHEVDQIRAKIKKDYQKINALSEKLGKIEMIHNAALATKELIEQTQKKLATDGQKEEAYKLNNAKKYIKVALKEVEETHKELNNLIEKMNTKLDKLFVADDVFEKARLKIAKENISKATQECNRIIFENITKSQDTK
jgi:hypothetical protein